MRASAPEEQSHVAFEYHVPSATMQTDWRLAECVNEAVQG